MQFQVSNIFLLFQANRAMSERTSLSSRHRRKSVPSYTGSGATAGGGGGGGRRSQRGGSVDPLLDSDDSGGGGNHSRMHRSVSRGDLDTHSVARSSIAFPVSAQLIYD